MSAHLNLTLSYTSNILTYSLLTDFIMTIAIIIEHLIMRIIIKYDYNVSP